MVEQAGALPGEAETSLADPRAQFVASLGRRIEALRQALFALEQAPKSGALRDHLRRRIHAFGAAAGVLGFDRVFEAFREAETVLGRAGATGMSLAELASVARTIDLVPSLVLGAGAPAVRGRDGSGPAALERRGGSWPISALAFGPAALVESFEAAPAGGPAVEWERTEDAGHAEEIVRVLAPDVAVVDADRPGAFELMETLAYDPLLDPVRVVAIGTFDRPEAGARLVALGVSRVLPRPVSPEAIKRAVLEVARERVAPPSRIEALGDISVEALGERLAHEIRRGLVEALKAPSRGATVSLGEGTDILAAVWSSVARVRELVTLRSGGTIRFDSTGPEGAIPLSPMMGTERATGGESRSSEGVSLAGRTIVVADDDPSVVWFLSGLLRAAGAEVLEAHDGDRALDLVRDRWPDLVVSDILMPGLDGFALCREIKRDIALSDIPVILLSWKEDLLQRVRELGADADGYLRKEATSSTVVQRIREVLLPRARVEARLSVGEDVRGRLDGLTPRLVLKLACRPGANVQVTIRDAAYLYEVNVRGGRVRSATRTTSEGRSERGERALSGLLGVRAGRFAVRRDETPCSMDWDLELTNLVSDIVLRARAAQRLLSDPTRVARVEIDEGMLEPYLAATPKSAGTIVRRLSEGAPPAELLAAGASIRLLESVLVDLVLHGAISRISGPNGEDLLATEVAALRVRLVPASVPVPASPGVGESVSVAPTIAVTEAPRATASAPPMPEPEPASPETPPPPDAEMGFAALLADSIIPPPTVDEKREPSRGSFKALAPPTSAPPEPSPLEVALRSLPSPAPAPVRTEPPAGDVASVPTVRETPPPVRIEAPRPEAPRVEAPREPQPAAPAEAPRAEEPRELRPSAPAEPTRLKVELTSVMQAVEMPKREGLLPPRPERKADDTPALELGDAVLSAIGGDHVEKPTEPKPSSSVPAARNAVEPAPAEPPISTVPTVPPQRAARERAPEQPGRQAPASRSGTEKSGTAKATQTAAGAGKGQKPSNPEGVGGALGIVAVVAVAAIATFALITAVRGGDPNPRQKSTDDVAPLTATALAPSEPGAPAPSGTPLQATTQVVKLATPVDMDLPAGISVASDRGLLEIEVGAPYSLFVDGVFVGAGPSRQLPLGAGEHVVRVQGDGLDSTVPIQITVGRRVRLGTTNAQ